MRVWERDPAGTIDLQVLHEMSVEDCDSLKSLFPAGVTKDLTKLEVLEVTECWDLIEIFRKNEKAAEGVIQESLCSHQLQQEKRILYQTQQVWYLTFT